MKKSTNVYKKAALLLLLILASLIPLPLNFYFRDKSPKFVVEQVEEREEEDLTDVLEIK